MIDSFKEKKWCCYSNGTSQNVTSECSSIFILQIFWANFKPTEIGTESPKHPNMFLELLTVGYREYRQDWNWESLCPWACAWAPIPDAFHICHIRIWQIALQNFQAQPKKRLKYNLPLLTNIALLWKLFASLTNTQPLIHLCVSGGQHCKYTVQFFFF